MNRYRQRLRHRWILGRIRRRLLLAWYWRADGDLDEAARHARQASRLARSLPAPVELSADIGLTTALIAQDGGDFAASRSRLASTVELLDGAAPSPERDRLLAMALTGLGDACRRVGSYEEADRALARAGRTAQRSERPDPGILTALAMTQGIVAKELGIFDRAAHCYAQVAELQSRHATAPADAAALAHNLAGLAYAQQRYLEAETHARRAVALQSAASPKATVKLAEDLAVLAAALAGQHRFDEARVTFEDAMTICQTARPPRHYEIAVHLHNLAAIDQSCGQAEAAERRYRQALAIKEQLLGADHPEVATILNNLGTLLADQHRYQEAGECYRRAMRIAQHVYPPQHPALSAIQSNLNRLLPPPNL